ncbi:MAG: AMP-binding protein, partial [Gemmatimonadetes bacterium]|nr:AMP-binding protein [Gemmatimonadota bacterium]
LDQPLARFGLDSLRAMELTHEIETAFGVHLDAPDLLAATSLADLLDRVQRAEKVPPPGSAHTAAEEQPECELAAGQQALCFLHDLDPEGAAYTIASALRLENDPDETAFEAAWRDVVARHPSLRARIVRPGGHLRQRFDVPFERIHEGRIEAVGDGEIESVLADVAYRPFDLEQGPLFRITRVIRSGHEYLVLAAHHVIADLWSLSIVLRDFRDAYEQATRGGRLPRVDVPSPAEFVAWQREYLESERGEAHFRAAAARLADPPAPLDLPAVRPRPASPTFAGALRTRPLDAGTTRALRDLAQRHDVTLYTVLLAAFQTLLSRLSGRPDVTVGAPAAGRTRSRRSDLVGYLVNSIVLRADLTADPAFRVLVRETGRRLAEALGGQDFPFPTLVKRLAPERDASRSPFFDVMFELRGVGDVVRGDLAADASARVDLGGGLRARVASLPRRSAQFDLSVTVTDDRDTLAIEYEYRTDLFDEIRIDEIADAFATLLAGAARAPDTPVSRLPLLSPAARIAALGDPPRSGVDTDSALLPRRFEAWVARTPDAPALWHGDTGWSYRALNERANAIARRLREHGVTIDSRVAVVLPKSPELIASCVAAMKAGGAFVPVDPGLPIARQRFLVESCAARAVIGSEELARETGLPCVAADAGRDPVNVEAPLHPEALAYVIFTSGTTGEPKG